MYFNLCVVVADLRVLSGVETKKNLFNDSFLFCFCFLLSVVRRCRDEREGQGSGGRREPTVCSCCDGFGERRGPLEWRKKSAGRPICARVGSALPHGQRRRPTTPLHPRLVSSRHLANRPRLQIAIDMTAQQLHRSAAHATTTGAAAHSPQTLAAFRWPWSELLQRTTRD